MKKLAKSERFAINISNIVNLLLFTSKVLASMESRSMAVIASTLDSLLDLLSGFILWFTSYAMKKPNQYRYPIGKNRMQPVVSQYYNQSCCIYSFCCLKSIYIFLPWCEIIYMCWSKHFMPLMETPLCASICRHCLLYLNSIVYSLYHFFSCMQYLL